MVLMAKSEVDVLHVNHVKDGIADLAAGTIGKCFFVSCLSGNVYFSKLFFFNCHLVPFSLFFLLILKVVL